MSLSKVRHFHLCGTRPALLRCALRNGFNYYDLRDDICDEGLDIKQDIHAGMSSVVSLCDDYAVCSLMCFPDQ